MSKRRTSSPQKSSPLSFVNRTAIAVLAVVMTAIFLAACSAQPTPTKEPATADPAVQPSVAPTATPEPYEDFTTAAVPPPDPERLAQITKLLSLVPESYGSALYLDMEFLRSNVSLAAFINPEVLGLDLGLPSIATGLLDGLAVAVNFQTHTVVTSFQSNFPIPEVIQFARAGFGLPLTEGGLKLYEGHDIWGISAFGSILAMAAADEETGVAAAGQEPSDAIALVESSLDAFDGRSARLLDAPGLASLIGNVPSGFAAVALSQCERLPLFEDITALPGCTGAVVTAGMLSDNLVVIHALIGFAGQDQARSAVEHATEALAKHNRTYGFEDLGARQEGDTVRLRVIVGLPKLTDVFRLFAPTS